MDYYQILEVSPTADEKKLKIAYLKAAKKYHPDIYDGVNKNHFQKVNEVYNILKFSHKRQEYDRK
jgi:curved DNA-binding protein CbpA